MPTETVRATFTWTTNLGHVMSLPVTAEGVETPQQRDAIRAIGCEFAQGYFYADPMPAAAIDKLLAEPGGGAPHLPTSKQPRSVPAGATVPLA